MNNQTSSEQYDLLVLGSGEAGKYLAWNFGKEGKRVAVVERHYVGGSCPNIACLPSKNVIHSAKVASYISRASEYGTSVDNAHVDMVVVRDRKRQMVDALVDTHRRNFSASHVELVMGDGVFVAPKTIAVSLNDGGRRVLTGEMVVVSTGTTARPLEIDGLVDANPMTHVEALELDTVPPHLLIVGGGFIGLEFAQAMRRFGSEVTIFDRNDRLLHQEDEDVSSELLELLKEEGVNVVTGAQITGIQGRSGEKVVVHCLKNGFTCSIEGTHLLVAAGRTPNTTGIGLEQTGVQVLESGYIAVDGHLRTSMPGIWAVGECAGSPQFTHAAFDDFRVVRDDIRHGQRVTTGRQMPRCLFTDPEFARIGLTETEAKEKGISYRLFTLPMASDLRTRTLSETRGFMKALVAVETDNILGFVVVGVAGGEIMSVVQMAILGNLPYTSVRDAILAHPTLAEGLVGLFSTTPSLVDLSARPEASAR